jgi:hypothetical protein
LIQWFQQAILGGAIGKIAFHIHHIPADIAALHHGLELAVIGGAIHGNGNAAGGAERLCPVFLLRLLGGTAPAGEHQVFRHGGAAANRLMLASRAIRVPICFAAFMMSSPM